MLTFFEDRSEKLNKVPLSQVCLYDSGSASPQGCGIGE